MSRSPDLTAALAVLERETREADPTEVPGVIGELERLKATLWARLAMPKSETNGTNGREDRLIDVARAAERLGVTREWLRRRPELPFVVKLSEGVVRYSSRGIDRYIAARRA